MQLTELENRFLLAVSSANESEVISCLEFDPNLSERFFIFDHEEQTPVLHYLAKKSLNSILELVLDKILDIDFYDNDKNTALHVACKYGNLDTIRILIQRGADITKEDADGNNVLHISCKKSYGDIAEFLIITAKDKFEEEFFVKYINSKTFDGTSPLHYATEENNHKIIELLLDNEARVDTTRLGSFTPLHHSASHCNQFELTKRIVAAGANLNLPTKAKQFTPLNLAVTNNCSATVEFLASNGANLDWQTVNGATALHSAAHMGYDNIVKILLQYTANANIAKKYNVYPLHLAAITNNSRTVEYLLLNDAEIEVVDAEGNTPLFIAAQSANDVVLDILYLNKANLSYVKPMDGSSVAHAAAMGGSTKIIDLLYSYDPMLLHSHDSNFGTVLHYAAASNNVELIVRLINYYSLGIELRDRLGFTALHAAVLNGHKEAATKLVELGADYNSRSFLGFNVYEMASHVRAKEVTEWLESKSDIITVSADSLFNYGRTLVDNYLYYPLCTSEDSESPFAASVTEEALTEVGSAALESSAGILEALSSDYCKIYKLGHNIFPLRSAKNLLISKFDCGVGYREVISFHNYGDDDFHVCLNKPGRFSTMLENVAPSSSMTLAILAFLAKGYGYDYVVHSHQRITGFWNGVRQSTIDYTDGMSVLDLFGIGVINYRGFEINLSGGILDSIKVSSYLPKLIINAYHTGKFLLYEDNSNAAQLVVQEISALQQDSLFYLAQFPSDCAAGDNVAFNLTSSLSSYKICESDITFGYTDIAYNSFNTLALLLPTLAATKSYYSAGGHVATAAAIGNMAVGIATFVSNWGINIFSDTMPSLSQYYANEFIDVHDGEGLYLAQYPATCVTGDDNLPYVFFYQIGEWSVCGKKEIVQQYTIQNSFYDGGFWTLWGLFSSADNIYMNKYGTYHGGKGEDIFVIFQEFDGKAKGFKLIIDDFKLNEDKLDFSQFKDVNDDTDLSFIRDFVKNKKAVTVQNGNKENIVTLVGVSPDELIEESFIFGEQVSNEEL